MRYRIYAPEPITGGVCGIGFANGQAMADDGRHRRALAYFRQAGYRVEAEEQPEPAPAAVEDEAEFDPAEHTVADVLAYLADADEDERARVLAAEEAGDARSTILKKGAAS